MTLRNTIRVRPLLSILIILITIIAFSPIMNTQTTRVYAYREDLGQLGIQPWQVRVLDHNRILLIGSVGGVYGVAVLNIEKPGLQIEDIYPLTGAPIQVAINGYPTSRIAVGTDKGEILLLDIHRGRITKYVYIVLGADFTITKMFLARTTTDNYIVATLLQDSAGIKHIYVLDEYANGILKISPIPGNATVTCPIPVNSTILDFTVLVIHDNTGYYYDASNAMVALRVMKQVVTNETEEEIPVVMLATYDLTNTPSDCSLKSIEETEIPERISDLLAIRGSDESNVKIIFTKPEGFVSIVEGKLQPNLSLKPPIDDYVGPGAKIVTGITNKDGSYFVIGLSDGRVRLYTRSGDVYRLKYIYQLGVSLVNLLAVPGSTKYTYIAFTTSGVQVMNVEPYPIPLFRAQWSLMLTSLGYIYGDATSDLKLIVFIDGQGLTIVKNADILAKQDIITTLNDIMSKTIDIRFATTNLPDILGGKLIVETPEGVIERDITTGLIRLTNIIPGETYTVEFISPTKHIYNGSFKFTVDRASRVNIIESTNMTVQAVDSSIIITVKYYEYIVNLSLVDVYGVVGTFEVYVDGVKYADNVRDRVSLKIPYGTHVVKVVPKPEDTNKYESWEKTITVTEDTNILVTLMRKSYRVRIMVSESGVPIKNAWIEIYDVHTNILRNILTTNEDGVADTTLLYGVYSIIVKHPQYQETNIVVAVDKDNIPVSVSLSPTITTLLTRFSPIIGLLIAVAVIAIVLLRVRKAIVERLGIEEVF